MGFKFGLQELIESKCHHGEWFSKEVWWRGFPKLPQGLSNPTAQLCQDLCPIIEPPLTNYNCNYGQEERKRKGNSTVFSNRAYESPEPLQTQVCVLCMGSSAEQKPFLTVGDSHGRKVLSSQEEKAGAQQGFRRHLEEDFFTLLPSLVLMLAIYIPKSRCFSGSALLKPEQATDNHL